MNKKETYYSSGSKGRKHKQRIGRGGEERQSVCTGSIIWHSYD